MDGSVAAPGAPVVAAVEAPVVAAAVQSPVTYDTLKSLQGEAFLKTLPADIAQKGYMKGVENYEAFVKKFDGAQTLMGQRSAPLPTDGADKWEAYHRQTAPKSSAEYGLANVGEDVQGLLHKVGASPWQAKALVDGYDALMKSAMEAEDTAFTTALDQVLGADREATLATAKQILAVSLPASMKPLLEKLDGNAFAAVAAMTKAVADKFGGADNIISKGQAPIDSGSSLLGDLKAQYVISSDASKPLHERKKAEEAIAGITAKMRASA